MQHEDVDSTDAIRRRSPAYIDRAYRRHVIRGDRLHVGKRRELHLAEEARRLLEEARVRVRAANLQAEVHGRLIVRAPPQRAQQRLDEIEAEDHVGAQDDVPRAARRHRRHLRVVGPVERRRAARVSIIGHRVGLHVAPQVVHRARDLGEEHLRGCAAARERDARQPAARAQLEAARPPQSTAQVDRLKCGEAPVRPLGEHVGRLPHAAARRRVRWILEDRHVDVQITGHRDGDGRRVCELEEGLTRVVRLAERRLQPHCRRAFGAPRLGRRLAVGRARRRAAAPFRHRARSAARDFTATHSHTAALCGRQRANRA